MPAGTISGSPKRLGHGIHGIVYAAERNAEPGNVAIKVHRSREVHERERNVYLRLKERAWTKSSGSTFRN
jgi:hypothetical protein